MPDLQLSLYFEEAKEKQQKLIWSYTVESCCRFAGPSGGNIKCFHVNRSITAVSCRLENQYRPSRISPTKINAPVADHRPTETKPGLQKWESESASEPASQSVRQSASQLASKQEVT
jgi:hypothetical protein